MRHLFISFSTLIYTFSGLTQSSFSEDSLNIVKHCQTILLNPQQTDSIHSIITQIKSDHQSLLMDDIYYYNYSKVLFQTGQTEQALEIAQKGLALFENDSLAYKASKHHNIIAAVYSYRSQYPEAISEFTKAVIILEHHDDKVKAALIKNNIANLFFSLSDFNSAYSYSKEALQTLNQHGDTLNTPGITAIVAISAIRLGRIEEGAELTQKSIELSEKFNNPIGLIVGNLSKGEWQDLVGNYEKSKEAYLISLGFAEQYRQSHYVLLNKIGLLKAELQLKNYAEALKYGQASLAESEQLSNENTRFAILKNTSYAYAGLKDFTKAYELLDSAHNLYIATAGIENKSKINELLIKYESEKKERKIISDQLEIASQKIKVNRRNNWIIALAGILILFIIIYWVYKKRQDQKLILLSQEAEKNRLIATIEGEEKERERLANELHDGIASALTGLRLKIEQDDTFKHQKDIIHQLENLHEDTRRISHNLMPLSLHNQSLEEALLTYAKENSNSKILIQVYQLSQQRFKLDENLKNSLYRICQELIQNVIKHSGSSRCTVQINHQIDSVEISIEDEGRGFNYDEKSNSHGLKSIKKRISNLGGDFHIESKINAGTLAIITLNKSL